MFSFDCKRRRKEPPVPIFLASAADIFKSEDVDSEADSSVPTVQPVNLAQENAIDQTVSAQKIVEPHKNNGLETTQKLMYEAQRRILRVKILSSVAKADSIQ